MMVTLLDSWAESVPIAASSACLHQFKFLSTALTFFFLGEGADNFDATECWDY